MFYGIYLWWLKSRGLNSKELHAAREPYFIIRCLCALLVYLDTNKDCKRLPHTQMVTHVKTIKLFPNASDDAYKVPYETLQGT